MNGDLQDKFEIFRIQHHLSVLQMTSFIIGLSDGSTGQKYESFGVENKGLYKQGFSLGKKYRKENTQ